MTYTYYIAGDDVYRVNEDIQDINDGYDVWMRVPGVWRGLAQCEIDDFCECGATKISESTAMRLISQK